MISDRFSFLRIYENFLSLSPIEQEILLDRVEMLRKGRKNRIVYVLSQCYWCIYNTFIRVTPFAPCWCTIASRHYICNAYNIFNSFALSVTFSTLSKKNSNGVLFARFLKRFNTTNFIT